MIPRPTRRHLGFAGILAAFVAVSVLTANPGSGGERQGGTPSGFNEQENGLRALFLAADALDLPVDLCTRRLDTLEPGDPALVAVVEDTTVTFDGATVADLDGWVRAGGRMLFTARGADDAAWQRFGVNVERRAPAAVRFAADLTGPSGAGPLRSARSFTVTSTEEDTVLAWVEDETRRAPWLVERPWGEGSLLLLADPAPLSNLGLRDPAAAVLAVRLLERVGNGGPIEFCETLHHGAEAGDPWSATWTILVTTPLGRALLAAGLVLLVGVVAGARRFGRVRERLDPPRRSEYEYLDALGGLLRQSGAWKPVGGLLLDGVRRRTATMRRAADTSTAALARQITWDRPADREDVAAALATLAHGGSPATLAAALRRLDRILEEDRHVAAHSPGKETA